MKNKKIVCMVAAAVVMSSLLFGCGGKEKTEENVPEPAAVTEEENGTKEEIPMEEEAENTTQGQSEEAGEQVNPESETGQAQKQEPVEAKAQTEKEAEIEVKDVQNSNEAGEEPIMGEVFGSVVSLEGDGFTLNQSIISDDRTTMVLDKENTSTVMVRVKEETVFQIYEIRNGGVNGNKDLTILDASASDLKVGDSVGLIGSWIGEEYHVTKVNITKSL